MAAMTRAQPCANWIGPPSLTGLWLEALLRMAAMLVSNLALIVRMGVSRLAGECHAEATPQALPRQDREPIRETDTAAATGPSFTSRPPRVSSPGHVSSPALRRGSLFERQRESRRSP